MGPTLIGYVLESIVDISPSAQMTELTAVGCTRIVVERVAGKHSRRPELTKLLDHLNSGDVLTVTHLNRLARSTRDLLDIAERLHARGAGLRSLAEPWVDTTTPGGRGALIVLVGLAEYERSLRVDRIRTGRAEAKARGVKFGRPTLLSHTEVTCARELLSEGHTVAEAAELLGVHRSTLYRALERSEEVSADEARQRGAFQECALTEVEALASVEDESEDGTGEQREDEPFFITEEIEAEMIASGYEFHPPSHVRTTSLSEMLKELSDEELQGWTDQLAMQEKQRRGLIR